MQEEWGVQMVDSEARDRPREWCSQEDKGEWGDATETPGKLVAMETKPTYIGMTIVGNQVPCIEHPLSWMMGQLGSRYNHL